MKSWLEPWVESIKMSQLRISDVEWKEDDPLFEFNDENVTMPQTPDAASTPVQTLTENKTGSSLKSPLGKKPCFWESFAVRVSKATPLSCLEPDYSNAELVGYKRPPLVYVIPWIKYKAQNMVEPTFRQELQSIREVNHLQYIIAMIVWFCRWRQEQGWWPLLPACGFQVKALATAIIETQVMSVTSEIKMTSGERQVLRVLTTLQYLAEVGPKSPPPGHVAHSVQSIMHLHQAEISFMPQPVLGYATLIRLRSTSVKTDIPCADISSLPSSVGSAGDMPQPDAQLGDYELAMGGMTLYSVCLTRTGEPDVKEMEKNPEVETRKDRVDKEQS